MDMLSPSPLGEKVPAGRMRRCFRVVRTALRLRAELSLLAPLIRRSAPPSPRGGEGETR